MAISGHGGKMSVKKCPKNFQMSEQYWGCLYKMSKVKVSPSETLDIKHSPKIVPDVRELTVQFGQFV